MAGGSCGQTILLCLRELRKPKLFIYEERKANVAMNGMGIGGFENNESKRMGRED